MDTTRYDVLLVEDREEDAELTMIALKEHKVANTIRWVKGGEEALNFLYNREEFKERGAIKPPKLVLLDLKMPKMDGMEVLKEIRSNPAFKTLPVVMLTTSREELDINEAYKLGVNSYIVKPVDFEQFSKSVREIGMYWLMINEPPVI
ncbi:MAG: response regulator [Salibacteraceae bacterium]